MDNINPMNITQKKVDTRNEVLSYGSPTVTSGTNISVDDFLKILAAELSNPSIDGAGGGGGSKTDYISQLAQLTTLEYMGELNNNIMFLGLQQEQQFGTSLIGKEVIVLDKNGENIRGFVDRVLFKNGFTMLEIDGEEYYVGNVIETLGTSEIEEPEEQIELEETRNTDIIEKEKISEETEINNNIKYDTSPMKRKEITEKYLSEEFEKEREYFNKNFKELIKE